MKFIRFMFSFLYVRNWHTGQYELSRPRAISFGCFIAFVLVGLTAALILQAPVEYQRLSYA